QQPRLRLRNHLEPLHGIRICQAHVLGCARPLRQRRVLCLRLCPAPVPTPMPTPASDATTVLLSADAIASRIRELAGEIERDYPGDSPIPLVCVLKGGFVFVSDLVRAMSPRVTLDFIALSSYAKGTTSSVEDRLLKDLDAALSGRDVIIVEDIVDTG